MLIDDPSLCSVMVPTFEGTAYLRRPGFSRYFQNRLVNAVVRFAARYGDTL